MECCSTSPPRHGCARGLPSPTACLSVLHCSPMASHGFSKSSVFFCKEQGALMNPSGCTSQPPAAPKLWHSVTQASPTYLMSAGKERVSLITGSSCSLCLPQVHRPLGTALGGCRGTVLSPLGLQEHTPHGEGR